MNTGTSENTYSEETRNILLDRMKREYDLYSWIKGRFYRQLAIMKQSGLAQRLMGSVWLTEPTRFPSPLTVSTASDRRLPSQLTDGIDRQNQCTPSWRSWGVPRVINRITTVINYRQWSPPLTDDGHCHCDSLQCKKQSLWLIIACYKMYLATGTSISRAAAQPARTEIRRLFSSDPILDRFHVDGSPCKSLLFCIKPVHWGPIYASVTKYEKNYK